MSGAQRRRPAALTPGEAKTLGGAPPFARNRCAPLLRALLLLSSLPGLALAQGKVSPAGSLQVPRAGHTATRLLDGSVLVVGGRGTDSLTELSSVERYQPKARRFVKAAPLRQGRSGHTATLLADGTVLVVGGTAHRGEESRFVALASAERYDPRADTWSEVAPLSQPRHWHSATLLEDGRVLVAGGAREEQGLLSSVELFAPSTNRFEPGPPLTAARCLQVAVRLGAEVLVLGGRAAQGEGPPGPVATGEAFDPASGAWRALPELADARARHAALVLADGRALVVGGATRLSLTNLAELWETQAASWRQPAHSLSLALAGHTATLLPDGDVLVAGGETVDLIDTPRLQRFEVKAERWCLAGNLKFSRKQHTATLLLDGSVLLVGGLSGGLPEGAVERWSPAPGACKEPPGLSVEL